MTYKEAKPLLNHGSLIRVIKSNVYCPETELYIEDLVNDLGKDFDGHSWAIGEDDEILIIEPAVTPPLESKNQVESFPVSYSGDFITSDWIHPLITRGSLLEEKEQPMNVIQAIKAKLSPVDRILVRNGYLNSNGTRTSMYDEELKKVAIAKLIEAEDTSDFRKELAKELKEND
jgi:hypothetical protein